jgi:type II secretory pathway pseudopilin PulG
MAEGKKGWKWWQKLGLGLALVLLILLAALAGFRRPWVTPLPGVRTEMSRPFLRDADLGPKSAYRLLLAAIEEPSGARPTPGNTKIWQHNWLDALEKLDRYGFPVEPPPPAPKATTKLAMAGGAPTGSDPAAMFGAADPALAPEAPWTQEQWEDIQRLQKLYAPRLSILDRAIAAPNPQVPQVQAAAGNYGGAVRDVERALAMAAIVSRGGCEQNYLISRSCDTISVGAIWNIVVRYELPVPELEGLTQTLVAHADGMEPIAEVLRAEAVWAVAAADIVYRDGILKSLDGYTFGHAGWSRLPSGALAAVDRLGPLVGSTPERTKRNIKACFQHIIVYAEKPFGAKVQREQEAFVRTLCSRGRRPAKLLFSIRDPFGYLLATLLVPGLEEFRKRAAQHEAMLRGMASFCAVEAFRKETGRLPEKLEELVPNYLPSVPADPFDGHPFRYLKGGVPGLPPDAWAVYSVGENFTDDGGTAHSVALPKDKQGVNPDLVWPSVPYPVLPPAAKTLAKP